MRDEIEKLCETLERLEPMNCSVQGVVQKLRRILDADPVSKLEAMGITGVTWRQHGHVALIANIEGEHYEVPVQLAASGKVSEDINDAATRLLARIEAKERYAMSEWHLVDKLLPKQGEVVDTLSDTGIQQHLKLVGRLWFFPDGKMYVYYTPKFWSKIE